MKKLLSMLLVCTIISSCAVVGAVDYAEEYKDKPTKTYSQKFYDVSSSHWAFSYIGEMYERGVINGYPDGRFRPDNNVERAEFAKIMVGAAGIEVENNYLSSFYDVGVYDWYAPYVEAAKEYLTGYERGTAKYYCPEAKALREDIAVALVKLKGYDTSTADVSVLDMFTDADSISIRLQKYIAVAVERGLVSGYEDGTFRGQDTITRAEAAAMLWRAFQYGNDNKTASADMKETTSDSESKDAAKTETKSEDKKETETKSEDKTESKDKEDKEDTKDKDSDTKIDIEVEDEEKKPYVIKKLASAQLEDSTTDMTMDEGGNIYFLDKDNCVYKLDTSNGNKSKLFTPSKLSIEKTEEQETEITEEVTETVETGEFEEVIEEVEETVIDEETGEETTVTKEVVKQVPITEEVTKEVTKIVTEEVVVAEYSNYVPVQVFYDDVNDRVLLSGYYKSIEQAFKSPVTDGHYNAIYDITGGKSELLSEGIRGGYSDNIIFYVSLSESVYRVKFSRSACAYDLNIDTGSYTCIDNYGNYECEKVNLPLKYGNALYDFKGCIYKYNFNSGEYEGISDYLSYSGYGGKDDCYYFRKSDGSMYKISVKTGKTTTLDVNFTENVEFADMGDIDNTWDRFFVIDDNTYVFYDSTMGAFRKLSKNK